MHAKPNDSTDMILHSSVARSHCVPPLFNITRISTPLIPLQTRCNMTNTLFVTKKNHWGHRTRDGICREI